MAGSRITQILLGAMALVMCADIARRSRAGTGRDSGGGHDPSRQADIAARPCGARGRNARPTRRVRLLIAPTLTLLVFAAGAGAYFRVSGSGSGTGPVSVTIQPVSIAASTATQSLVPTGAASGDVAATITNPDASRVHIGSLSLATSQGTGGFSANAATCALSFATQTNSGNGWTIPGSGQLTVDLTNSVTMGTSATSSCQGQTFAVYLTTP